MNESELPLFRSEAGLWMIELRVRPLRGRLERFRRSLDTTCALTAKSRALALLGAVGLLSSAAVQGERVGPAGK